MHAVKNFKRLIPILMMMALCDMASAQDFKQIFKRHYEKAEESATQLRPLIRKLAQQYGEDSHVIESVVFPELMRYNEFYDVIETGSLMSLYTSLGQDYADFSIGPLQQKPSFALSIERYLNTGKLKNWAYHLGMESYSVKDNFKDRSKRVDRLTDPEWQIKYLIAMLKCIRDKHHRYLNGLSNDDQLQFIASAYNCGWDKSGGYIKNYQSKAYYSLQMQPGHAKYCFARIALYRYREATSSAKYS